VYALMIAPSRVNGVLGTRARGNTVVIISTLLFLVITTKIEHLTFVALCEYGTALCCHQVKAISIIWSVVNLIMKHK
jgi:hypothetical protein